MSGSVPHFELGVYSFGNTPRTDSGAMGETSQAVRDALEAARVADEVGLDFFGFGEHHTRSMPLASPTSLVVAAAATTRRIKLGTAVTVLSTDDPIRVFEQLAVADAIAPGRIEAVAGRGSSTVTFGLFDFDEGDYDMLFASKLELLRAVNAGEGVDFDGPHRRTPLRGVTAYPRPAAPLPIWLGTGGSPDSVGRAAHLGMPMFLGILGGTPQRWGRYAHAYRQAFVEAGHSFEDARIAVAVHGFVGPDNAAAKMTYRACEAEMFRSGFDEESRRRPMSPPDRTHDVQPGGMVFAGDAEEIAERIVDLHQHMGHHRQIIQMDVGGLPHREFLRGIELLGTEVLPRVKAALGGQP